MSPFWPTMRPFLITSEGDGNWFIAFANFVGSMPTSCGVAVGQLDTGNVDATTWGVGIGGDDLAPAGEPASAASERSVTIKSVAKILGERFLVVFNKNILLNIILYFVWSGIMPHTLLPTTSAKAHL